MPRNGWDPVVFPKEWSADKGDIWKLVMDRGFQIYFLSKEEMRQGTGREEERAPVPP